MSDNMNSEFLVQEFLDGSLSHADEDNFFLRLASENELRLELKNLLAIRNAIHSDVRAFTPKSESTLHIFDTLGLVSPTTVLPTVQATAVSVNPIGSFFSRYSGYMLSVVVSSLITAFVIFNWFDFDDDVSSNEYSNNISDFDRIQFVPKQIDSSAVSNPVREKTVYKYIYKEQEKTVANNLNTTDLAMMSDSESVRKEVDLVTAYSSNIHHTEFENTSDNKFVMLDKLPKIVYYNLTNNENKLFALVVRKSDYFARNFEGISRDYNFALDNLSIAGIIKVNDELEVGVEYRRERFAQEFAGREGDSYFIFQQEPDFNTFSLLAEYKPEFTEIGIFTPYIGLSAGINNAGPVGRFMLGTDINFSSMYYMNFGFDYSILFFKQEASYFISPKAGVHFGFGLNF